jgi:hypothetical protein
MKEQKYSLTQEQLNSIAAIAAEKAVDVYRSEERRGQKKRANESVRVTRKKLQSYRRIKASLEETEEFTEDEKIELRWAFVRDLMGNGCDAIQKADDRIRAVENKRKRDMFEIHSIDRAVSLYKKEADNSKKEEGSRRYRVLYARYIRDEEMSVEEIAAAEDVSEKTVERDLRIACEIVSVYLLGM